MSRPRKPFGSAHPGRLPATMIRVLAAEMSDPQRFRRGKRYAADDAVLDITIEPGIVTCEVQGSRATPYIASLEVRQGDGMPLRRDVSAHCSCPDDENFDRHACKHVVATMLTFGDELMLEPRLLDLWRGSTAADTDRDPDPGGPDEADGPAAPGAEVIEPPSRHRRRRHLTLVPTRSGAGDQDEDHGDRDEDDDPDPADRDEPQHDTFADALARPAGTALPALPDLAPFDQPTPTRPALADVLRDALGHMRIEWD